MFLFTVFMAQLSKLLLLLLLKLYDKYAEGHYTAANIVKILHNNNIL